MIALKLVMTTAGLGRFTAAQTDTGVDLTVTQLEDTGVSQVTRPAGDLWGLRYVECLALEAAWQRREIARQRERNNALHERLTVLENRASRNQQ